MSGTACAPNSGGGVPAAAPGALVRCHKEWTICRPNPVRIQSALDKAGCIRGIYVVKLLSRYVIREHVGPLIFALSALTSLLMLQYVTRQLANLAGKGLPWSVIGEFFVLSLPFTVAMTMPMAVLVATLYAFGRMASENEITAFKANGVKVRTLMRPVVFCALGLSIFMVWFNDQVLPAANHRLAVLQLDIARTRPTLALNEQVLNRITDQFLMRVARVNAANNHIYDVVIYDLSGGPVRKTIYADSGAISAAVNNKDLELTLYSGFAQEFVRGDYRQLQRSHFETEIIRQADATQGFESSSDNSYKGDREMTVCELHRRYIAQSMETERVRLEYLSYASDVARLGGPAVKEPKQRPRSDALGTIYCQRLLPALKRVFLPAAAAAQVQTQSQDSALQSVLPAVLPAALPQDSGAVADSSANPLQPDASAIVQMESPVAPPPTSPSEVAYNMLSSTGTQLIAQREVLDSVGVEIHKKFALSFACLVFVLFGPPIALRFPRGGVGVTIGVSILVFGLYYACLVAGETLADKGKLPPYIAMWLANIIFTLVAAVMLLRVEYTTDASRGGGIREWWSDRRSRREASRYHAPAKHKGDKDVMAAT